MSEPVLVELCAGSAAVSLRWLHPRAKPPIAYQGGKRAYADAILVAMGLRPGGGARSGRVVLVEAGPWGEAWVHWAAGGIPDTVERLRAWAGEDPRELWERFAKSPVPVERAERVATWLFVQFWGFAQRPVTVQGGAFVTVGFSDADTRDREWRDRLGNVGIKPARTIALCVDELRAIRDCIDWRRVQVMPFDALEVDPLPRARVYIDPPYHGTTGYGWHLTRDEVIGLATRWRAAGCEVTVSEAEPLPIPGWHHYELGRPVGNRRTWSKQQREWLTMSERPVGVFSFAGSPSGRRG